MPKICKREHAYRINAAHELVRAKLDARSAKLDAHSGIARKSVQFQPESSVHFAPESGVQFTPESVSTFERNTQSAGSGHGLDRQDSR